MTAFQDWVEGPDYPGKSEADVREGTVASLHAGVELLSLNKSKLRGLQLNSYLLKGTRLLTNGSDVDFAEYCHWTYPEDDASTCQTSYMMARKLKPHAERTGGPAPESIIERSRPLSLSERPPVVPSEKRKHLVGRVAPPAAVSVCDGGGGA